MHMTRLLDGGSIIHMHPNRVSQMREGPTPENVQKRLTNPSCFARGGLVQSVLVLQLQEKRTNIKETPGGALSRGSARSERRLLLEAGFVQAWTWRSAHRCKQPTRESFQSFWETRNIIPYIMYLYVHAYSTRKRGPGGWPV